MMTSASCTTDGLDDLYSWSGPSWLSGPTHAAVTCQKGQKSVSDPTPNQDNFFIVHTGNVGIFGVCDGHGPFGHLVSFRLVQTLPFFIASSPCFGGDWEVVLKEAFLSAQSDLVSFSEEHGVFIEASGAAGSVVVFDGECLPEDAGIMVASYSRHDSRLIYGSRDHTPNLPEERARLEAAGSEVREVGRNSWRIYLAGIRLPRPHHVPSLWGPRLQRGAPGARVQTDIRPAGRRGLHGLGLGRDLGVHQLRGRGGALGQEAAPQGAQGDRQLLEWRQPEAVGPRLR
ncbi:unnamed protein product [Prorocentrum cordatum]|uniref:PPM-type phosphatase domain-containing protein n=1 Tax=Prorocentrum cordatum TaxID=2364126 RepID=A0ABN9XVC7_9DINO|nr:unnamed protein product [Polarella glacialis]